MLRLVSAVAFTTTLLRDSLAIHGVVVFTTTLLQWGQIHRAAALVPAVRRRRRPCCGGVFLGRCDAMRVIA